MFSVAIWKVTQTKLVSVLLFKSQHCYNSEWVHAMCGGGLINDRDLWDRQSMLKGYLNCQLAWQQGQRSKGRWWTRSLCPHDGPHLWKCLVSGQRSHCLSSPLSTRDAALPHLYIALLWSYLRQLVMLLSSYNTATKESFSDNFVSQQNWIQVTTESHLNVLSWSPCNQNCSDTPGFTPHHHFQPFHLGAVYKFNESFIQTYFKSVCGFTFDSLTSSVGALS